MKRRPAIARLCALLLLLAPAGTLHAQAGRYEVLLPTGVNLPEVKGQVTTIFRAVINAAGQVGTFLTTGPESAILRLDGIIPTVIVRQTRPLPGDYPGQLYSIVLINIDAKGRLIFGGTIADVPDPSSNGQAILRCDGKKVEDLARAGAAVTEQLTLSSLGPPAACVCNDKGQVVFAGTLRLPGDNGVLYQPAIVRGPDLGNALVAQALQPVANYLPEAMHSPTPDKTPATASAPDPAISPLVWNIFQAAPALNGSGDIALDAQVSGVPEAKNEAIFLIAAKGTRLLAQRSMPVDDQHLLGPGVHDLAMNEMDQVAFISTLETADGKETKTEALFTAGVQGLHLLVQTQMVPPGLKEPIVEMRDTSLNRRGQVALIGVIGKPSPKHKERMALLLYDGKELKTLAAAGLPSPDPNWTYQTLGRPVLNDAGQLVFHAGLVDKAGFHAASAIFFYDPAAGLVTVAQTGQKINGEEIKNVDFAPGPVGQGSGFNNSGQVVFVNDHRGIILWTAPRQAGSQ